ncbi:gamma-glutamylcyclotransferase [Flexibacterium corallicola]|uniref:gamma-glutamylcyclotransferase n=1 Tax=Flexibacterium corallicola TaxID=3037259 RepID=UPI00286F3A05|nr:gamma-glutamylcyclotransferase [Pseudovibrio sp. M1P-2-3]
MRDFWVFGYGSLIWNPGFRYERAEQAILYGAHRSLCIYSWIHRGTQSAPGLVFGLDRGGSCHGVAFHIAPENIKQTVEYLREREQQTQVYLETYRSVKLTKSSRTIANVLAFVVDRSHTQYAGALPLETQLKIIRNAEGASGKNHEYVANTAVHLQELGIRDNKLDWLQRNLKDL